MELILRGQVGRPRWFCALADNARAKYLIITLSERLYNESTPQHRECVSEALAWFLWSCCTASVTGRIHTAGFVLGGYRASLHLIKETQSLVSRCFSPSGVPPKEATDEANWQVAKHKKELKRLKALSGWSRSFPIKAKEDWKGKRRLVLEVNRRSDERRAKTRGDARGNDGKGRKPTWGQITGDVWTCLCWDWRPYRLCVFVCFSLRPSTVKTCWTSSSSPQLKGWSWSPRTSLSTVKCPRAAFPFPGKTRLETHTRHTPAVKNAGKGICSPDDVTTSIMIFRGFDIYD